MNQKNKIEPVVEPVNDQETAKAVMDYLLTSKRMEHQNRSMVKKERKFYLSDMGKCYRARWLKRKGVTSEFGESEDYVNWTFEMGNMIHDYVYKALEAQGKLLESEESFQNEHFSFRYDAITKDSEGKALMDVKSASKKQMFFIRNNEKEENIAQLLGEMVMLKDMGRKDLVKAILIYVNKEPGPDLKDVFVQKTFYLTKPREEKIRKEIDDIVGYWQRDEIPPCTCPAWMKAYNSFLPLCEASEKQIKMVLKQLKDKNAVSTKEGLFIENPDGTDRQSLVL